MSVDQSSTIYLYHKDTKIIDVNINQLTTLTNKIIKKEGAISSEEAQEDVINVSLKFSSKLNSAIEALQKNKFGMKRTKKQWIIATGLCKKPFFLL